MKSHLIGVSRASIEAEEAKRKGTPVPPPQPISVVELPPADPPPDPTPTAAEIIGVANPDDPIPPEDIDDPIFDESVSPDILRAIEETGSAPDYSKIAHDRRLVVPDRQPLVLALRNGDPDRSTDTPRLGPVVPFETINTEDPLQALWLAGWEVRYDKADLTLHARHRSTGESWASMHPKKNPPLAANLVETVNRLTIEIRPKTKGGKTVAWEAVKPRKQRAALDTLHDELLGLAADAPNPIIAKVHPLAEFFDRVSEHVDGMTPEEQDEAERLSTDWLLLAPCIEWMFPDIARAAGANITAGLFLRLAEAKYGIDPFMQKSVPHLTGRPDTGKTGLLRAICPPSLRGFAVDDFTLAKDTNRSHEKLIGKWFVILDDFTGTLPRDWGVNEFNGWLTAERPNIDVKYLAPQNYPNTRWLVSTGTTFYAPRKHVASQGDIDGFYRRFLITPCAPSPEAEGMEPGERVGAIRRYAESVAHRALAGACIRWRRAVDPDTLRLTDPVGYGIEPPRSLDRARAQALGYVVATPRPMSDDDDGGDDVGGWIKTPDEVVAAAEEKGMTEMTKADYARLAGWSGDLVGFFMTHGHDVEKDLRGLGWGWRKMPSRRFVKIDR